MRTVLKDTFATISILMLTILIGLWFDVLGFNNSNIITIFILGILFIAVFTSGRIYGLLSSVFNVFAFNYLFTEPRYSFALLDAGYLVTFFVMFISSFVTSTLALQMKNHARRSAALKLQAQREELRANLLRSISHDLRTPLTSISGNAGILMSNSKILEEAKKQELYGDIYDDSKWLINVVENLLYVTRIENGTMNINMHPELISEVIEEALLHIDRKATEHQIDVNQQDKWIMAKMDSKLIIQVLVNLLNNAITYTDAGSEIEITVTDDGEFVRIDVADNGAGIPEGEKGDLFAMYYTNSAKRADGRRGLGLGLPLCKAIVTAHGGKLEVRDNVPSGCVFSFTLQSQAVSDNE